MISWLTTDCIIHLLYGTMSTLEQDKAHDEKDAIFWLGVALCVVYLSYRYPLQINDSGTSPTYSDTPAVFQAGKFVLAAPLAILSLLRWLSSSLKVCNWPVALCALFLCSFSSLKMLQQQDNQYAGLTFWMMFGLSLALGVGYVTTAAIDRCFRLLLWYSFATSLVQVVLFAAFGRLPALAFAGTYAVRFGGFLDDPNGFPVILFLLMGWSYGRFSGGTRFLVLVGLTICLFLTQSWTAIAFFLLVIFLLGLVRAFRRPATAILAIAVLPMIGVVALRLMALFQTGFLLEIMESKRGSIEGHVFPWDFWASRWKEWAMFGDWKYNPYESWWQAAMVNFGLLWFVAYLAMLIALLVRMRRVYVRSTPESKPVFGGLLLFGIYFLLGSFNLPFPIVFPINALFFLFFFLVAFGKIFVDHRPTLAMATSQPLAKATGE
jgi:hypothetical protein